MSSSCKSDDCLENLPDKLKEYFPTFIRRCKKEFDHFSADVKAGDFKGLSKFYHSQVGIVASYHLFRYEELVKELKQISLHGTKAALDRHLETMNSYLVATIELSKNLK